MNRRALCRPFVFLAVVLLVGCRRTPDLPTSVPAVSPSPTVSQVLSPAPTETVAVIPSLTSEPVPTPPPTLTPTAALPPLGGRVIEVGLEGMSTLNPLLADDGDLLRAVGPLLFDSLLRVHPQSAALMPGLARDWQVSQDGRTFTFRLRPGVTWHDGQPFSATDVVFTLAVAGDPEGPSPYRFDLADVSSVTALDDATVAVTFDEPGCDALYAVGRVPILPRHLIQGQKLAEAAFNRRPVGTGPFVFGVWEADGSLVLNANEGYWAGQPHLDGWTYRVVSDEANLPQDWHLARLSDGLEPAPLPDAFRVLSYPADRWYFVALNNDHPILGDATVRRALALALDRERLLAVALDGHGSPMGAPWLATHWAMAGASLTPLAYAPDQAQQLLTEAGWRDADGDGLLDSDGQVLRLSIITNQDNPIRERIAILAQQYWQVVGVSAQVNVLPWGGVLDDLFGHTFDVAVFDWPLEPGPDQSWLWASDENEVGTGFNFVSFANAHADALLAQGRVASGCDPTRRAAAYRDLARQLAADGPCVFLFAAHRRLAVSETLVGPQPGPFGELYWNVTQWYLTGDGGR